MRGLSRVRFERRRLSLGPFPGNGFAGGFSGSRSGMALVEATLIMPIIVLTAVLLVFGAVTLFQYVCITTQMHGALRTASGEITSTVGYSTGFGGESLYIDYSDSEKQAMAENSFMGALSGLPVNADADSFYAETSGCVGFEELALKTSKTINAAGPLPLSGNRTFDAAVSIVDETDLIRNYDYLREVSGL